MNDEISEFLVASIFGLMGWFFGGLDEIIEVLIALTAVDYFTGICRAGIEGKISSKIAFKGIARKIVMFLLVGVANVIDRYILDAKTSFRVIIIVFYIGNEGMSIIENAGAMGIPIPGWLRGKFLKFMENSDKSKEDKPSS